MTVYLWEVGNAFGIQNSDEFTKNILDSWQKSSTKDRNELFKMNSKKEFTMYCLYWKRNHRKPFKWILRHAHFLRYSKRIPKILSKLFPSHLQRIFRRFTNFSRRYSSELRRHRRTIHCKYSIEITGGIQKKSQEIGQTNFKAIEQEFT